MFSSVYPFILNQQCCGTGGGVPGDYTEALETFILDFNEFTQYDPIPELPGMLTSSVTGSNGTVIEFRFWGQNTALDGVDNNYFVGDGDMFATFPGMLIAARSASVDYSDHSITVEWDMNKTVLQPAFDLITTVQYLDNLTFKCSGQCYVTIEDTGEGYDKSYTQLAGVGWQQAPGQHVLLPSSTTKLSNNRVRFEPDGLGLQTFTIDEVEIVIGTRTLV